MNDEQMDEFLAAMMKFREQMADIATKILDAIEQWYEANEALIRAISEQLEINIDEEEEEE